jgi:hypothetical protein
MFNQVKSARKSYKQKNQMVQELFHERPSLTSPSKQIPYKIPNIPQKPKNSS